MYVRVSSKLISPYVRPLNALDAQHGIQHLTLDNKCLTLDNQRF